MNLYRVFYEDEFGDTANALLQHNKQYNQNEFKQLLSSVRYSLGHSVTPEEVINSLVKDYGFIEVVSVGLWD